ncbi:hypothetical protein V6N12_003539 [Hibiscus sabdariffa]|uniref:WAT1-related protein n=1 Tax=Hibiscus sabdariffa TaxID=183260 RepID=A0ABR2B2D7_9ROSI
MVFMRFSSAGLPIVAKYALNRGTSQHVLLVYRFAIATLVLAPFAIVFDRHVIDQNLYYTGIKYTTVTIATALCNVLPAFVFLLAWVCRFEKVDVKKVQCQAKILGTIGTVGGAMIMTMFNGPMLTLPWTKINNQSQSTKTDASNNEDTLKGVIMILVGCVCWACFVILQFVYMGKKQKKGERTIPGKWKMRKNEKELSRSELRRQPSPFKRRREGDWSNRHCCRLYFVCGGKAKIRRFITFNSNTEQIPISGELKWPLQMEQQRPSPFMNLLL